MLDVTKPYYTPPEGSWVSPPVDNAAVVVSIFDQAARLNLESPLRAGSVVTLPDHGRLLMTGDLHDNTPNLRRILAAAALDNSPDNHVILHEVVHGPHRINNRDFSVRTLARVASLKIRYPNQVHILQANHELAQFHGGGIIKNGNDVCQAFTDGVEFIYRDNADAVTEAMQRYIRSLLLAVRTTTGVFCSHSLPSKSAMASFDPDILSRVPTDTDLAFGGSAYQLVWGRNQSQELLDELALEWKVSTFICGHQPTDNGYQAIGTNMLLLGSDDHRGHGVLINLAKPATRDQLLDYLVPLQTISVD